MYGITYIIEYKDKRSSFAHSRMFRTLFSGTDLSTESIESSIERENKSVLNQELFMYSKQIRNTSNSIKTAKEKIENCSNVQVYGVHSGLRIQMEREHLSGIQRPFLSNSRVLETSMNGEDEELNLIDFASPSRLIGSIVEENLGCE
jgi:hypothetical protein